MLTLARLSTQRNSDRASRKLGSDYLFTGKPTRHTQITWCNAFHRDGMPIPCPFPRAPRPLHIVVLWLKYILSFTSTGPTFRPDTSWTNQIAPFAQVADNAVTLAGCWSMCGSMIVELHFWEFSDTIANSLTTGRVTSDKCMITCWSIARVGGLPPNASFFGKSRHFPTALSLVTNGRSNNGEELRSNSTCNSISALYQESLIVHFTGSSRENIRVLRRPSRGHQRRMGLMGSKLTPIWTYIFYSIGPRFVRRTRRFRARVCWKIAALDTQGCWEEGKGTTILCCRKRANESMG